MNIFERATKQALRFNTSKNRLTVEDLWDLPLDKGDINLDKLAISINADIKEGSQSESFVGGSKPSSSQIENILKLDILKHIIQYKLDAKDKATKRMLIQSKRERLTALKDSKINAEMKEMSLEDIEAALLDLES